MSGPRRPPAPASGPERVPNLSAVLITRNEAARLASALASVCWAGEIVVLDSESTDATREIARQMGGRVVVRPFTDYADQRNAALRIWAATKVCVKPVNQGSSVDTYIVSDAIPLPEAIDRLLGKYGQALVEKFIDGPELTVGVLGERVLPVIQIIPQSERAFYDYQAKYQDDNTTYLVNPPLDAGLLKRVQEMSLTVFKTVGCRDLSRTDWRIEQSNGQPYFLEVNTLPGFTSHSLLPKAAGAIGIDFAALCQHLVEMALRRGPHAAAA